MTTYTLRQGSPDKTRADVVVIGIHQGSTGTKGGKGPVVAEGGEAVAKAYGRRFAPLLSSMGVTGQVGEAVRVPTNGTLRAAVLVLVGLGGRSDLDEARLRRAAGVAARTLGNAASVALALPATDAEQVRAVCDGFLSGSYSYRGVRSKPSSKGGVSEVAILSPAARQKSATEALDRARTLAGFADLARDLVNTPANLLTPQGFVDAVAGARPRQVSAEVLDEAALAELGCGGILGVGAGSANPPRLLKLEYRPRDATSHVALVGKGITYDSGGLSIKPASGMVHMKDDMAGAASVVAATYAAAELGLPVRVTAYAPLAENMISGSAYRPGDVLTMFDGQTVEIRNTDAEGRLVLADALGMAAASDVDAVVEISTLTGPCVVALGDRIAGLFGDDGAVADVQAAADRAGELVWRLPMSEFTSEQVRTESPVADLLQHNWVRWGSASWAAAFLKEFVRDKPFAHIDMAGPAFNTGGAWGHVPAGATGYGVATLVEYLSAR
ncbi:leucyl aminopeptidase [Nocardioides mangrovicus]|uniref:Probable cytosol aminopeptidase n=1 Tax=Nocardioides mangrovicus TaxID=2478913 RepID=A0A3L8P246_9ACTN|nr:leucyl aminopeptidase [Nocardioides mangrovicus]RLV49121.1 leucyl aminopeptidase [Nocardioides mangrovicus]